MSGMASAIHQLCPSYSGTQTPTALRLLGYGEPLPFFTTACRSSEEIVTIYKHLLC